MGGASFTLAVCVNGLCHQVEVPPVCECQSDDDCAPDGNPCTSDTCVGGCVCAHLPGAWCCKEDRHCTDYSWLTADYCINGECKHAYLTTDSCMGLNEDRCYDGNRCTNSFCFDSENKCYYEPILAPGCCLMDADCSDCNPNTINRCIDNVCVVE